MSDGAPMEESAPAAAPRTAERLASLDVYRGLTMLLLAFTVPNWGWQEPIAETWPHLTWLTDQCEHVTWRGLTLWDMIQPSFMFMVGVALPYSVASRRRRGATGNQVWWHAISRAVLLVLLGVALRSLDSNETSWTFEDVVTQIGLAYVPLFFLATRSVRVQVVAAIALLGLTWLLFALWPLPGEGLDLAEHSAVLHFEGFWAHWNQNTGPGHYLDRWLLNLFPRSEPFTANGGGYNTLNFVPSLATMILGLFAGQWLRSDHSGMAKLGRLIAGGIAALLIGLLMDYAGLCPLVKRIWTPSFALVSGGLCLLVLALLYGIIDLLGVRRWSWPAEVVGRNPLAMYVMTWTLAGWLLANLTTHLGSAPLALFGEAFVPMLENLAVGCLLWSICWWMDRNRVFVRL